MHVQEAPAAPPLLPGEPPAVAVSTSPRTAEDVRAFAREAIGTADVTLTVVLAAGSPASEITVEAARMAADLIVLGTHGRSGFRRLLLGSVTERLLRATETPLLIVPPPVTAPHSVGYDTILCPIDFSQESMRALDFALSLAQESNGRIVLLHVLEGLLEALDPKDLPHVNVAEYFESLERETAARLAAAVPEEAQLWARPAHRVVRGRAHERILEVAREEHASLIVMGVRGRGALDRLLFGSNTERVIRQALCPVLTIHADVPFVRVPPPDTDSPERTHG
jgi:nucleotide-binding universal stress UspA family protein